MKRKLSKLAAITLALTTIFATSVSARGYTSNQNIDSQSYCIQNQSCGQSWNCGGSFTGCGSSCNSDCGNFNGSGCCCIWNNNCGSNCNSSDCGSNNPDPDVPGTPDTDAPDTDAPVTPDAPGAETPEQPDTDHDGSISAMEREVVTLVNQERAAYGLSPLTISAQLCSGARLKSQDMRNNNYFDHNSPTYGSPFDMMKSLGITYAAAGENIAKGYSSAQAVVSGWMNSSGHRANILSENFTSIGVGYVENGNYWTQWFARF